MENEFLKFMFEAPEDDPPDAGMGGTDPPPDVPDELDGSEEPPDMDLGDNDIGTAANDSDAGMDEDPPDMGMSDDGGMGNIDGDDPDEGMEGGEEDQEQDQKQLPLDEKISAIMNQTLYQQYLALLTKIGDQLSAIKKNSDILYSLSNESMDVVEQLNHLDENIRMYIDNIFLNKNYSSNFYFYNKCVNLYDLLNNSFDKAIRKGISSAK